MSIPYTFAGLSGNVPASYLDTNFTYLNTSPGLTSPTVSTPATSDNSTLVASTAFVNNFVVANAGSGSLIGSTNVKCSVTTAGSTATFSADEIVIGTTLGGATAKVGSYSQTVNLATTGAGGMDTGTAPASGYVSIYAIQGSGGASILACNTSTSNGTVYSGTNMPSGYTRSSLIGIWPTNGSSLMVVGYQQARNFFYGAFTIQVISSGNASSYTSFTISNAVPSAAKSMYFDAITASNSGQRIFISPVSNGPDFISLGTSGTGTGFTASGNVPILTSQTLYYNTGASGGWNVYAYGYSI